MNMAMAIALVLAAASTRAHGGTLADAAFYESLRRIFTPPATRSLTMSDLPASAVVPPAAMIPLPPGASQGEPAKADEKSADAPRPAEPEVTETMWRARMTAARESLERDDVLAAALQSRINALTTDFIGRDDPAQKAELNKQRSRAIGELDRLILQIEKDKLAIAAIEEDARKKGIPPGWIR
jgi:hypothetical protein